MRSWLVLACLVALLCASYALTWMGAGREGGEAGPRRGHAACFLRVEGPEGVEALVNGSPTRLPAVVWGACGARVGIEAPARVDLGDRVVVLEDRAVNATLANCTVVLRWRLLCRVRVDRGLAPCVEVNGSCSAPEALVPCGAALVFEAPETLPYNSTHALRLVGWEVSGTLVRSLKLTLRVRGGEAVRPVYEPAKRG